jgi:hypothetical protein
MAISPFCKLVIGVDVNDHPNTYKIPNLEFYQMKTRDFEEKLVEMKPRIDMAFIDACHESDVVIKDFRGIFPFVVDNGLIFLHDTYPNNPKYLDKKACSDCWKTPLILKEYYSPREIELVTLPIQPGLTIVRKLPRKDPDWISKEKL